MRYDEVQARSTIIKVLAGIEFKIEVIRKADNYTIEGFKIITDYSGETLEHAYAPLNLYRSEFTGDLKIALDEINAYIKDRLRPIIEDQKQKIIKAL